MAAYCTLETKTGVCLPGTWLRPSACTTRRPCIPALSGPLPRARAAAVYLPQVFTGSAHVWLPCPLMLCSAGTLFSTHGSLGYSYSEQVEIVFNAGGVDVRAGGADSTLRLWSTTDSAAGQDGQPGSTSGLKHLQSFPTKATPVFAVKFTRRNLLLGSGALTLRRK